MTIAEQLSQDSYASIQADLIAIERDQDWENEATTFTFSDGSRLRCSGGDACVVWTVATVMAASVALGGNGIAMTSRGNGAASLLWIPEHDLDGCDDDPVTEVNVDEDGDAWDLANDAILEFLNYGAHRVFVGERGAGDNPSQAIYCF